MPPILWLALAVAVFAIFSDEKSEKESSDESLSQDGPSGDCSNGNRQSRASNQANHRLKNNDEKSLETDNENAGRNNDKPAPGNATGGSNRSDDAKDD